MQPLTFGGDYPSGVMQGIVNCPKPVIAEVTGVATAAGCQLVVFPDYTAIIHGQLRRSYAAFYSRSRQLASALTQMGIGRGDILTRERCALDKLDEIRGNR